HGRFIGFDLGQHITFIDLIAFFFQPADETPFLHRWRERFHMNFCRHYRYITLLHAATMRSTDGFAAFSSVLLYGIRTSACNTRRSGASRSSNASSFIMLTICEPMPAKPQPSST